MAVAKATKFPLSFLRDVNVVEVDAQVNSLYIIVQKLNCVNERK